MSLKQFWAKQFWAKQFWAKPAVPHLLLQSFMAKPISVTRS